MGILIVGGGNLGEALKNKLSERPDVKVRIASRKSDDVKLDITDSDSVKSLDETLGAAAVDHVVLCCGTSTFGPITQFNAEQWKSNVDSKLIAVTTLVMALVGDLKVLKDGGPVTITSGQAADT